MDGGWFGGKSPHAGGGWFGSNSTPSQTAQPTPAAQQPSRNMSGAAEGIDTSGMAAASSRLTAAEQGFIIDAAHGGLAEVELGRLAEEKGTNLRVRDFGITMVQDHTKANQELTAIAERLGVTPPTTLSPAAQVVRMKLQQTSGTDFDRQYLEQQAAAHDAQRTMFEFASKNARDAELRAFAQRTLPVIERHRSMLRQMTRVAMHSAS
jgi:putative membrane protein